MPLDTKQPFHFFASTAFAWGTGLTREAAIRMALEGCGSFLNKRKGMYVWSVVVEAPQATTYDIAFYKPVGVTLTNSEDGQFTLRGRRAVIQLDGEPRSAEARS